MGLPSITGYVEVGGWLFDESHLELSGRVLMPAPRRYTVLDQVRTELRSIQTIIFWLASIGAIIYSALVPEHWVKWIALALSGLLFLVLANAARIMIGVVRHGAARKVTLDRIDKRRDLAAETFNVPAGDSSMTVVVGPPIALETMLKSGPVDVLVVYDPRKAQPRGIGFALRPHEEGEVDLGELSRLFGAFAGRPQTF